MKGVRNASFSYDTSFPVVLAATAVAHYYTVPTTLGADGYFGSVAFRFTYCSGAVLAIVLVLKEIRDWIRRKALRGGEV